MSREIAALWAMLKVNLTAVVVRALGAISKCFNKWIEQLTGIRQRPCIRTGFEELQEYEEESLIKDSSGETRPEPCDSKSFYVVRSHGKFPGDHKNWSFVVPIDTKKKKSISRAICIFTCLQLRKNNLKVKMEKYPKNLQWDDSLKARFIEEVTFFLNNGSD